MRQRILQNEDRNDEVLDARLQRDGDDPRPGLIERGREDGADQTAEEGQAAAGEDVPHREHLEDFGVHVEDDRSDDDEDDDEERTQDATDGGGDARLEASDQGADGQRDEDGDQTDGDAAERNDDARFCVQHRLAEREQ